MKKTGKSTIKDVAREAGVSISVVSYVINATPGISITKETQKRVRAAVKKLGYHPHAAARRLRNKKSATIAVVSFWKITDPMYTEVLAGISEAAAQQRYHVLLSDLDTDRKQYEYLDLYRQGIVDGVILVLPADLIDLNEAAHLRRIRREKIPALFINNLSPCSGVGTIAFDYEGTAGTAVRFLHAQGHRTIDFIGANRRECEDPVGKKRIDGFRSAAKELEVEGDVLTLRQFERHLCEKDPKDRSSAIVVSKIIHYRNILGMCAKYKVRIPQDLSVVCANHNALHQAFEPKPVCVGIPLRSIGENAVHRLLKGENESAELPENRMIEGDSVIPKKYDK